jgi:hypothetical protein
MPLRLSRLHRYILPDGQRVRRKFTGKESLKEAKRYGTEIVDKIIDGEAAGLTLTNQDRSDYLAAVEHLKPSGVRLPCSTPAISKGA